MHENLRMLRCSERLPLVLPARCRSRSGFLDRVVMVNLSPEGCRIESQALTLHAGDLVVIRPDGIEGLCGDVRWISGHAAGIRFDAPLYAPVVEHLHRTWSTFLAGIERPDAPQFRHAA